MILRLLLLCLSIFSSPLKAQNTQLIAGPMQGHTTSETLKVWMLFQYAEAIKLELYNEDNQLIATKNFEPEPATIITDYAPCIETFSGLGASTTYFLKVYAGATLLAQKEVNTLEKQGVADFSFLTGSCAFLPPKRVGFLLMPSSTDRAFTTMSQMSAEFMIWLGDNFYYLSEDVKSVPNMLQRNIITRQNRRLHHFLQSMPQYAIWDDHDYGPNDSDKEFKFREESLQLFKNYWANIDYGTPETPGVFHHFRYQDAEFFMLDTRYYKSHKEGILYGKAQLEWLEEKLKASTATFKFILGGVQMVNYNSGFEGLGAFPEEYEAFFDLIERNDIKGVMLISGDRHFSELYRKKRADKYDLYEMTCSPITSFNLGIARITDTSKRNPSAVPRTKYFATNFGKISITGEAGNRQCTLQILTARKGELIWEFTLHESDLD